MFYDALLHILDPVMIFIQDLSHPRKLEAVNRGLAPGQFQQQLQVAADDLMLWRGRGNLREAAKLPVGFLADVLRRSGTRYETAVPILLKWLPKINDLRVKEAIVRALSVPWARPLAAEPLISEFRKANESTNSGFKWAIANALEVVADESVLEEIIELVQDKHHGKSREMLAAALGNMESPRAIETLIALLGDEEVAGHALSGLRKLKAQQARAYIQRFLTHKKAWIRSQAKRALAALDKV